jgi:hypothetical protein
MGVHRRFSHSVGDNIQVHNGERHLPIFLGRCHGLRRLDRRFIGKRILGTWCLVGWDHLIQWDDLI